MSVLKDIEAYLRLKDDVRRALDVALTERCRRTEDGQHEGAVTGQSGPQSCGKILCQNAHPRLSEGP